MTEGTELVQESEPITQVAKRLAREDIGLLPVCQGHGRLAGVVSDRDSVVKVVAQGLDPARTQAGDVADQAEVVTIGADDDVKEIIQTMKDHRVRRRPVITGTRVVGMVAQADLAGRVSPDQLSHLLAAISA